MFKIFKLMTLITVFALAACGGGGGSSGSNPTQQALFSTAGSTVTLPISSSVDYEVGGGVPPYRVGVTDAAVAVAAVRGKVLTIGAISAGVSPITVFDNSGASISVSVRVGSSVALYTTAPASLTIGVGQSASRVFTIGGGGGPYTVQGSANEVAKVEMIGATQWKVTGLTIGSTNVRIRDAAGIEIQVAVAVGAPELRVSPTDFKLFPGMQAVVKISGGQPPYRVAGGIPAAIDAVIFPSTPDELVITGRLVSELEIPVADATGQTVVVKVEIIPGQGTFGFSPSVLSISENDNQPIVLKIFGAAPGRVCLFTSDSRFLKPAGDSCKEVKSGGTLVTIETGTLGSRCVNADALVTIRAVDSSGSVGSATINILDNGFSGASCTLPPIAVTPTALTVSASATTRQAVVSGGSGRYLVSSSNEDIVSAVIENDVITVTRKSAVPPGGITITIRDSSNATQLRTVTVTE